MVAVLPRGDGSVVEIEGEYGARDRGREACHHGNHELWVRTVKPLPVTEPTATLARIIDGDGVKRYRSLSGYWFDVDAHARASYWSDLPQPVTVVDADPTWEAK